MEKFTAAISSQGVGIPLIAAAVTMLTMINVRNNHIAERARANVLEMYSLIQSSLGRRIIGAHLKSLKEQNKIFVRRYQDLSVAFLLMALCIFALASTFVLFSSPNPYCQGAGLLSLIGAALCFLVAMVLAIIEFLKGPDTLKMHVAIMERDDLLEELDAGPPPSGDPTGASRQRPAR